MVSEGRYCLIDGADIASPKPRRFYFLGYDPASLSDWSALAVIGMEMDSTTGDRKHSLTHLERFAMGTPYPTQIERVKQLALELQAMGETWLVVDSTGLGRPITDYLKESGFPKRSILPVTISGGNTIGHDGHGYTLPKRDLVSNAVVLLQTGRLKIAANLPLLSEMVKEMLSFKIKVNTKTGHDSYEAWRESDHDDLVLGTCLGLWFAENVRKRPGLRIIDQHGYVREL